MRRGGVGANRQTRGLEALGTEISAETRASARSERNPIAISVFIPSFSDVP
jgi:hypothetical protein